MPLHILCPHCQATLQVPDGQQGKAIRCGRCKQTLPVPVAAPPPSAAYRLDVGSATSPGRVRERNEDCFLAQHLTWSDLDVCRDTALVIVADGVGGHRAGEQAARLVVRTVGGIMSEQVAGSLSRQARTAVPDWAEHVTAAITRANQVVLQEAQANAAWKGMAATAAVVLVWNGEVVIGHVGDCRVYHYRQEALTQVTKDQTVVARMVELGTLSAKEARRHSARNEITQAVGLHPAIQPASYRLRLERGDSLIVASDGLSAHVDDSGIAAAVRTHAYPAARLAHELVEAANRGGGSDNVTVAAVTCY